MGDSGCTNINSIGAFYQTLAKISRIVAMGGEGRDRGEPGAEPGTAFGQLGEGLLWCARPAEDRGAEVAEERGGDGMESGLRLRHPGDGHRGGALLALPGAGEGGSGELSGFREGILL